jgi:hypothetical protein
MLNFIYLQFLVEHIRSYRFLYFRRTRQKQRKFLDRTIQYEWIVDETSQQKEWYKGTVMPVISGNDGKLNAVYEVQYDGDDDAYVIDHLIQDFHAGSVVFCDL